MMFCLISTPNDGSGFDVLCSACNVSLGTMQLDMIRTAIMRKGDILCPECRRFHCQFCGVVDRFMPDILRIVQFSKPNEKRAFPGQYRICKTCFDVWTPDEHPYPLRLKSVVGYFPPEDGKFLEEEKIPF